MTHTKSQFLDFFPLEIAELASTELCNPWSSFFACWLFYSQDFVLELGQKKSRDWLKYRLANPGDCPASGEPIRLAAVEYSIYKRDAGAEVPGR